MKKIIINLIFLFCSYAKAQDTLTYQNNAPVIGDSHSTLTANATGVNPGGSGANQIWDFRTLVLDTASHYFNTFINPTTTSGYAMVQGDSIANLASFDSNGNNFYYYSSVDSVLYYGMLNRGNGKTGYPFTYDNPQTQLKFPFYFGASYTDTWDNYNAPCVNTAYQSTTTYDGYGVLLLPGVTYSNSVRTYTHEHQTGSCGYNSQWKYNYSVYTWYARGIKFPVLTISVNLDSSFSGNPAGGGYWGYSTIENVTVNNINNVSIKGLKNKNLIITIYPNPAQNNFTVETNTNEKQTLQLFDVNGKLILTQIINGTTTIDVSNLNAGVYNINIVNNDGVVNKRLVIVR